MSVQEGAGLWVPPDGSETQYSVGHTSWRMVEHDAYVEVQDPVLGNIALGQRDERVFRAVLETPLGRRSLSVTQLSKLREHAPIPNIYDFFRAGHVIGNVALVNYFIDQHPVAVTEEERISWGLSVMLDDLAHGIGSHLTDMILEGGNGGKENAHQKRAKEAWRYGGVEDALQGFGIKVDKQGNIKGYERPPWVESDAPNLCVERWQYAVEEMRLWLESAQEDPRAREVITRISDLNNLTITEDGRLAFKDEEESLLFSKAYLLLSTEDWNEPVNRVIEHLIIEAFKYAVYSRRLPDMHAYDNGTTAPVGCYTYAIDRDLQFALRTSRDKQDDFMFAVSQLLSQLGKEERWRFVEYKRDQFIRFLLDARVEDYPSALLNGHMMDYGPPSSSVEIEHTLPKETDRRKRAAKAAAATLKHTDKDGVQYGLQPMKNRYVDPLVMTAKGPRPLSAINKKYRHLLQQHVTIHASEVSVRLAVSGAYERLIHEIVSRNVAEAGVVRERLKGDQIRWQIDGAAKRSIEDAETTGRLVRKTN